LFDCNSIANNFAFAYSTLFSSTHTRIA
jgi:hypothetical protein